MMHLPQRAQVSQMRIPPHNIMRRLLQRRRHAEPQNFQRLQISDFNGHDGHGVVSKVEDCEG